MNSIDVFVARLRKQTNSDAVQNPYRRKFLADNLSAYLYAMLRSWAKQKGRRVLMVGEAPGYKGCMLTGVPFSSGRIYQEIDHPFLLSLKDKLTLKTSEAENTASIVWRYLASQKASNNQLPLFWNAFPFHPHVVGDTKSNRAPTRSEVDQGEEYLQELEDIFKPTIVVGVGRKGVLAAQGAFPDRNIVAVRHPSYGGKADFIEGMNEVFRAKRA